MKKNIGVFFGSKTAEHDVSITSAYVVMKWLERIEEFEVFPIYITNKGKWIYNKDFIDIKKIKDFDFSGVELSLDLGENDSKMHLTQKEKGLFGKKEEIILDIAFHILHGLAGEDGSIQGLCEMLEVPYVGPGILGGSTTLDKIISKDLFKVNNLPIVPYLYFEKGKSDIAEIEKNLKYPLFVKPYNLGSSIGISKVENSEELKNAIEVAEHFSPEIIVEEGVNNLIELNCAVCEKDGEVITTYVEQPNADSNFLSFEKKYIVSKDGGGTMTGNKKVVKIPADIPENVTLDIQNMAKKIFKLFRLGGAPRIDFLYDEKNNQLYVNEINPIPGAMQMHLWEKSGISQTEFLKILVDSAIDQAEKRKVNIDFKSDILNHTISF
ncbi:MAG: D-alanine--D-alanine ligase, partial [Candidatus Gracilibacteria bacterium]|nr:D-alanine--D-alanine ligase [Candidatus Gracilibacteria bacterium]